MTAYFAVYSASNKLGTSLPLVMAAASARWMSLIVVGLLLFPASLLADTPTEAAIAAESQLWDERLEQQIAAVGPAQVSRITFSGNKRTRERILQQELQINIGDTLSQQAILHSVERMLDLGLFRDVQAAVQPLGAGQVAVNFSVQEKWYFLPIPRFSADAQGGSSLGFRLRWSNVAGLNQTLQLTIERDKPAEEDRDEEREFDFSYMYPQVGGTALDVRVASSYQNSSVDVNRAIAPDDDSLAIASRERQARVELEFSSNLNDGRKGWLVGGTAGAWRQSVLPIGNAVLADELVEGSGKALYSGVRVKYDQLFDDGFATRGFGAESSLRSSLPVGVSTFDFWELQASAERLFPVRESWRRHRLALRADVGLFGGGPRGYDAYSLGGSRQLRGFERGENEGNAFLLLGSEYQAPFTKWQRLSAVGFVDVAQLAPEVDRFTSGEFLTSVGAGIRWRLPWFVNVRLELMMAYAVQERSFRFVGGLGKAR